MDQKLITFAVPCYNSAAYMRHCIETLLSAGEQAEIILVDDGSVKDETPAICDEYAAKYPTIVKAIHQENGGHGEGVNQGIRNATGLYYKVVDSDDWLDTEALKKVLARLAALVERHTAPDLMICNYVYEHVEDGTSHTVRYTNVFPQNRLFSWMREHGYLIRDPKRSDYNMPTQRAVEMCLFEIKETTVVHSDGHTSINKTPKVTGKGQIYFVNQFLNVRAKRLEA